MKNKRLLSLLLAFAMLITLLVPLTVTTVSADAPTLITNQTGLAGISASGNYKLANDITISGTWTGISGFTGTLDGDGHTITIADGATVNGGLFKLLNNGATVKDLNIMQAGSATWNLASGISGSGAVCLGTVAACLAASSDFNNTAVTQNVSNKITIQNVTAHANIVLNSGSDANVSVGGIIGESGIITTIENCVFSGSIMDNVNRSGTDMSTYQSGHGGIVGQTIRTGGPVTINQCINNADVKGYANAGGILGHSRSWGGGATALKSLVITKCVNYGTITCSQTTTASNKRATAGGIVGYGMVKSQDSSTGTIMNNINYGDVTGAGTGDYAYVAGIFGCINVSGTATISGNINYGTLSGGYSSKRQEYYTKQDGGGTVTAVNNYSNPSADTATTLNAVYAGVYTQYAGKVALTCDCYAPTLLNGGTLINNQADLAAMTESGNYTLANDITITGSWTYATAFTGTLDGDGHTITFADGATVNGGLFKTLNQGATIKNLNIAAGNGVTWKPVADAAGSGSPCVGGVAASAEAGNVGGVNKWGDTDFVSNPANTITVQNVTVTANIAISGSTGGDDKVAGGGIIGEIGIISLIKNCVFSGSISDGTRSKVDMVGYESGYGGIIGVTIRNGGPVQIIECINNGNVSGYGQEGGILGYSRAWGSGTTGLGSLIIEKCINNGTITCQRLSVDDTHYATVGGIAGYIYVKNNGTATLLNNVNNGDVIALATSGDSYASGVVGILRRGTANAVTFNGNAARYDAVTTNGTVGRYLGKPDGQGDFSYENNVAFGATPSGVSAAWAVLNSVYPNTFTVTKGNRLSLAWVNNKCAYLDESNYRQLFSLALDGIIRLRIGVAVPGDLPGSLRLIVSKGGSELQNVSMADAYDAESGYYVVSAPILAKEMADSNTYTVTVRNGAQTLWTTTQTISVKAYAEALLSHSEYSEWHDLMSAMLKYGAAAQNLFDYHTGTPAADISGGITVDTASLPSHTVTGDRSFLTNIRASLSLEAGTDLNFYFKPKTPGANLTATVERGGVVVSDGVVTEWVGEDGGASNVFFAVRIRNLAAEQLDDWYDVTVTDGSKSITVHYSGLCWAKAVLDGNETAATKTLAKGIALYANQAIAGAGYTEPIVLATPGSASSYYISYPAGADTYLKSAVLSFAEKMSRNGIYFATSSGDNDHLGKPIKILTNGSITGWTITFDANGNITVTGKDHLMAINGFRYLVDVMTTQTASGSYIITNPTNQSTVASAYTRSGWLLAAPAYENGTLASALYDEGTGLATDKDTTVNAERSYAMYIRSTTSAHFAAYESKLVSNGYTLDASSSATAKSNGSNLFRTYRRGTQVIFLYFDATNGVARVIDDQASTPETEFEYTFSYNSSTATDLILYGMKYNSQGLDPTDSGGDATTPNSGAFIIIKQADNSIMLIDGGIYLQATDAAVDALWNYLHTITGKAANETITISCWYITHPHLDHYYMVSALIEKYHENLDLQRVMFNFPKYVNDKGYEENTRTVARAYYPDVMFMKCHTGQSIQLGSLTLDVLATHEDLANASSGTVSFGEGNDMSTVLRITFPDGSRYMSMGDATEGVVSGMIGRLAASELSCKFFEVPHHGYNELTSAQCNAFAPKYVFFPNAIYTNFPSNYGNSYRWRYTHSKNNHDRLQSAGATNFYYAGSGTYRLTIQNGGVSVTSSAVVY